MYVDMCMHVDACGHVDTCGGMCMVWMLVAAYGLGWALGLPGGESTLLVI